MNITVYHCRSDVESLDRGEDIVLSATCFTDKPIILAAMYGCTEFCVEDVEFELRQVKDHVFHPLVLPMLFVELERKRLLDEMDVKYGALERRVLDMKTKLKTEAGGTRSWVFKKLEGPKITTLTERDFLAVELWRSINRLTNGLQTLLGILESLREQLGGSIHSRRFGAHDQELIYPDYHKNSMYIGSRLQEMMAEIRSKLRGCEGLLQSMQLIMQSVRGPKFHGFSLPG